MMRPGLTAGALGPSIVTLNTNKSSSSSSSSSPRPVSQPLEAFPRGENMGRVGFDPRSFSPWDGRSSCLILRATSLSL